MAFSLEALWIRIREIFGFNPIVLSKSLTPKIVFQMGATLLLKGVVIEIYG